MAALPPPAAQLSTLPLEVVETLGLALDTRDRAALACCCKAMWARADIARSGTLWGNLVLRGPAPGTVADPVAFTSSLASWLARCSPLVRRVRLEGEFPNLGPLVASLALPTGSKAQLAELELVGMPELNEAEVASLAVLRSLTRLRLEGCQLAGLPPALGALGGLRELRLDDNAFGQAYMELGEDRALAVLGELQSLTALSLANCGLGWVPGEVGLLPALAALDLSHNSFLGEEEWGEGALEPLANLGPSLTRLALRNCSLTAVPAEVAALSKLVALDLRDNALTEDEGGPGWEHLAELPALCTLQLQGCGVEGPPEGLGSGVSVEL